RLINRETDYAVKALLQIARNPSARIPVSELAEKLGIPHPFLRKILQTLQKKGVVLSSKGKGGGFVLALRPRRIHLLDVMKIFQGPLDLSRCLFRKKLCPDLRTCPLRKKIIALEKLVVRELKVTTLHSLLAEEGSGSSSSRPLPWAGSRPVATSGKTRNGAQPKRKRMKNQRTPTAEGQAETPGQGK
ncbi:MAG: Rrf2 family transcriptional regulator, partial [Acidobacteriota bacterium]